MLQTGRERWEGAVFAGYFRHVHGLKDLTPALLIVVLNDCFSVYRWVHGWFVGSVAPQFKVLWTALLNRRKFGKKGVCMLAISHKIALLWAGYNRSFNFDFITFFFLYSLLSGIVGHEMCNWCAHSARRTTSTGTHPNPGWCCKQLFDCAFNKNLLCFKKSMTKIKSI